MEAAAASEQRRPRTQRRVRMPALLPRSGIPRPICNHLSHGDTACSDASLCTSPARESYSSNGGPSPTPFGLGPVAKARIGENCQALRLWQRLLSFFVMAGPARMRPQQRIASALLIVAAWFGAYAFTWLSKWIIASWTEPTFDIGNDVMSTMQFRISGENAKVSHWPLAATAKLIAASILSWGAPLFVFFAIIVARMMRRKNIDWQRVFLIAWPALIPPLWFEVLSSHSQIHASFVSRSAAASTGVLLAALLIQAKATPFELVHQLKRAFTRKVRGPAVEIPPLK